MRAARRSAYRPTGRVARVEQEAGQHEEHRDPDVEAAQHRAAGTGLGLPGPERDVGQQHRAGGHRTQAVQRRHHPPRTHPEHRTTRSGHDAVTRNRARPVVGCPVHPTLAGNLRHLIMGQPAGAMRGRPCGGSWARCCSASASSWWSSAGLLKFLRGRPRDRHADRPVRADHLARPGFASSTRPRCRCAPPTSSRSARCKRRRRRQQQGHRGLGRLGGAVHRRPAARPGQRRPGRHRPAYGRGGELLRRGGQLGADPAQRAVATSSRSTRRSRTYQFWDANVKKAVPARYVSEETVQGLTTYKFVSQIAGHPDPDPGGARARWSGRARRACRRRSTTPTPVRSGSSRRPA